ncbi:MAG: hypothetical protein JSV01_06255 [Desulfobacterales bacterium]|nr:MAG: hypothetical protein JSV01_06255 [Desulfobacterales bacterium]UCG81348.1 MAG: hypothetical protein JSV60_03470 [Desulfobacterales bacterium]
MRILDEKAQQASEKKAALGLDIEMATFESAEVLHDYVEDLSDLSDDDKAWMILAGVDASERHRSGTYVQKDTSVIHSRSKQEGRDCPSRSLWKSMGGCRTTTGSWSVWTLTSTQQGPCLICTMDI